MVVTLAGCPSIPRPRTFGDGAGEGRGYFVGAIPFFRGWGGVGAVTLWEPFFFFSGAGRGVLLSRL